MYSWPNMPFKLLLQFTIKVTRLLNLNRTHPIKSSCNPSRPKQKCIIYSLALSQTSEHSDHGPVRRKSILHNANSNASYHREDHDDVHSFHSNG